MLTKWYKIRVSEDDRGVLLQMQKNYSIAFRKIYNNMELMEDGGFIKEIRTRHNISAKAYEYLTKECKSFYDRDESTIKKRKELMGELRGKMNKEKKPKKKQKINKKIIKLSRSLKGRAVFGGKSLLQKITKGKDDLNNKEKFRKNRLLPLCFYGETERRGNRFFNFKGISDGFVLFKYEGSSIKINIDLVLKDDQVLLLKMLEELALNKQMPLTVKLTSERIYITYDEALLHGNKFDEKAVYSSIKEVKDKDERKALIRKAHVEFEDQMLKTKNKNLFFAIDINPEGIGYCILKKKSESPDGDFDIIQKKFIDFSGLDKNLPNKRKYELSITVRHLFNQLSHYNCAYFVSEDLTGSGLGTGDNGSRKANRKINNLWNRIFIDNLFTKYCNIRGIKRIPIEPAYSSFIGNIIYPEFDPVAASIEIGRRGITKYIRGSRILPEFCVANFINDLTARIPGAIKIYGKINACKSWKELFNVFSTAKMSVRRKLDKFSFLGSYLENKKSKVKILCFL